MNNLLPKGVEIWWARNVWDRSLFEKSHIGSKFIRQRELLIKAIKKHKPSSVLILCCGVGIETAEVTKLGFVRNIVAIDINPISCRRTRELAASKKLKVINMNVYEIDWGKNFDAVVCIDALHHLGDQTSLLDKIHTALKPGGIFIGNYFGREQFMPLTIKKHGALRAYWINFKHHFASMLFKLRILPNALIMRGWMRAFLLSREEVYQLLNSSQFDVINLISNEWHFFVAQKSSKNRK